MGVCCEGVGIFLHISVSKLVYIFCVFLYCYYGMVLVFFCISIFSFRGFSFLFCFVTCICGGYFLVFSVFFAMSVFLVGGWLFDFYFVIYVYSKVKYKSHQKKHIQPWNPIHYFIIHIQQIIIMCHMITNTNMGILSH